MKFGPAKSGRLNSGLRTALRRLRAHPRLSAAGALLLSLAWLLGALPVDQHRVRTQPLDLPLLEAPAGAPATPIGEITTRTLEVAPGDTYDLLLDRAGLPPRLRHRILNLDENTKALARIRPGEVFELTLDPSGQFAGLRVQRGEDRWLLVREVDGELVSEVITDELQMRMEHASGVITDSLFLAGKAAGLSDPMIMRLANIFAYDVDFVYDIRAGDRFHLFYEAWYRDGEKVRDGDVVAATFINDGDKLTAIRFDAGEGPEYFAPDGRNMKKAFLRAPLNYLRVSSRFNPKRFHPILKRVRPHNGIDYGASTGTPVYAAGDGVVQQAAYGRANGNYVFIKHPSNIVTKYLHLSKRTVKKGQRVRQGQVIGHVGSTGLASGPHLHYEFVVGGVHRDPATVPLPKATPLPPELLSAFRASASPLIAQLDYLEQANLLASRD